jgi:hypothetical protein
VGWYEIFVLMSGAPFVSALCVERPALEWAELEWAELGLPEISLIA